MTASVAAPQPQLKVKLGEELPIFCERCGYSLYGLPQLRCEQCQILHFHCPECGHRQPINTLRPAFQRILGRARALWLAWIVFLKLNFFGWLLFAWFMMGYGWFRTYSMWLSGRRPSYQGAALELVLAFSLFAFPFAAVSRMLLLRWRNSGAIGLVLSGLVVTLVFLGAALSRYESRRWDPALAAMPLLSWGSVAISAVTAGALLAGALVAWPAWRALVFLLLPKRTGQALLEWQRSLSDRAAQLARE